MFKKVEEINDLNDISLVNPDLEKKNCWEITYNILSDSLSNMVYLLLISLTDNISLIFIGKKHSLQTFITLQLCLSFIYIATLCFSVGVVELLHSKGKTRKLYFECLSLIIFITLLIFLPMSLLSYFFMSNKIAFFNFLIYISPYLLFKLVVFLQLRILEIKKAYLQVNFFLFRYAYSTCYIIVYSY